MFDFGNLRLFPASERLNFLHTSVRGTTPTIAMMALTALLAISLILSAVF
jgi:hypothetical protein